MRVHDSGSAALLRKKSTVSNGLEIKFEHETFVSIDLGCINSNEKRSRRTQCCPAYREDSSKTAGASLGSKPKERFFENARKATVAGHPLTECKWNRLSILRAPACDQEAFGLSHIDCPSEPILVNLVKAIQIDTRRTFFTVTHLVMAPRMAPTLFLTRSRKSPSMSEVQLQTAHSQLYQNEI